MKRLVLGVAVMIGVSACASRPLPTPAEAPRRVVVGTENQVRVDGEILVDSTGSGVAIRYEVTNGRANPIAVADILPETSFDLETRTVTVSLGSEVPGAQFLPRLMTVPAGEKRAFTAGANVYAAMRRDAPTGLAGVALRLKLNFLSDTKPFRDLLDIPEKAVHDPKLADALFPAWLELNETVFTNSVPVRSEPGLSAPTPAIDVRRH